MSRQDVSHGSMPTLSDERELQRALRRIATVALLAILLGLVIQALILTARLASGGVFPGHVFLADVTSGVAWSFLVCLGVAIGVSLGRARPILAGITAMVFAPMAVALAKAAQKAMASLIGAAGQPAALSLATIGALRAVEYAVLGWMLARLAQGAHVRAAPFLATGAVVGLVFGGAIAALSYRMAALSGGAPQLPQVVGGLVNEIGFPIGCAFVIYVGQLVGRGVAARS